MKSLMFVFSALLMFSSATDTSGIIAERMEQSVSTKTAIESEIIGSWEIVTETPRGTRKEVVRIEQEGQGLVGHAKRNQFEITQEGDFLYWTNTMQSPMGKIVMKNSAQVTGGTMEGFAEMTEGPRAGSKFPFTGTKLED